MQPQNNILTAIIADDEVLARDYLNNFLTSYSFIKVISNVGSGNEAIAATKDLKPDILFLDIQMPGLDGFEVLQNIKDIHLPLIVFVTAFDQYAINAFEHSALDYLLKPYSPERFATTINKIVSIHANKSINSYFDKINLLLKDKKTISSTSLQRIPIKGNKTTSFIEVNDIEWIEADGDYTLVHTKAKAILSEISISEFELKLDSTNFIRVHRSTIINISYLKEITPYFNGEFHMTLNSGQKIKSGRTYKDRIKSIITL